MQYEKEQERDERFRKLEKDTQEEIKNQVHLFMPYFQQNLEIND